METVAPRNFQKHRPPIYRQVERVDMTHISELTANLFMYQSPFVKKYIERLQQKAGTRFKRSSCEVVFFRFRIDLYVLC